ncbi:Glycosyl hydrolases family 2 [Streptomyces sp. yr375]|uniref:glycoside hydrolase family 2 TIM barrel-domain containing protein n=1 Tax=Streptomyces sp. yr375 TaxID=1761906 RepID=UPI0008B8860C|nr:glycoside hydrolase family 2 TIM barrel-domain containing protein [Streptomyces sp. yr375]SEP98504.1 Glycosyl hydrolases family 2 [Streptomyces sp. yr375]
MSRSSFNGGWQYREKSNPFAEMGGAAVPYQDVTLPHDAMITRTRDPELPRGAWTAYHPGGVYEYRKFFDLPEAEAGKRVVLEFEGVYRDAVIHVNGDYAGQRPSGYARFLVDASDLVRAGRNEIHVEARNHQDGRWYTGAGIYRDVWLHVLEPVHLAVDGIRVRTPDIEPRLAVVEAEITVVNDSVATRTVEVRTEIADPGGRAVASSSAVVTVLPGEPAVSRLRHYVDEPALWSVDTPQLHTATVELYDDGRLSESRTARFGIRRLQLDPASGLRINGETVKLRGACVHHDNGVIGAATIARADERRVEILKRAGFNAIRSSHNPVSTAMLDACDRLGMLVIDEAFDMWTTGKTEFGAALHFVEWWERDLESMIARDFNHPSVVLYSIGNEIPETGTPRGGVWGRRLAEEVRALDDTRFVTNAVNGMLAVLPDVVEMMQPKSKPKPEPESEPTDSGLVPAAGDDSPGINTLMSDLGDLMNGIGSSENVTRKTAESFGVLDVAGMNYLDGRYETDRKLFPNRIILGTETFPTLIDRYWDLVERNTHVLGDFTWTGWDYLGEAGIGRVRYPDDEDPGEPLSGPYPWLVAGCGDIDITGWRRPASYYREIVYGLRADPYIAVQRPSRHGQRVEVGAWAWSDSVASWSWGDFEGRPVVVEVYSDADEVELLVNDRSVGRSPVGPGHRYRTAFDTVYEQGNVTAIAYRDGVETGRFGLTSATGPVRLRAVVDRAVIRADSSDLAFVEISLVDGEGNRFAEDRQVTVTVTGPGVLQGMGSGNPATEETFTSATHRTYDGRAVAVVRPGGAGRIGVTVTAAGCAPVEVVVDAVESP